MQVNYNKYIYVFLLSILSLSTIQAQKFKTLSTAEKKDMVRLAENKIKDLSFTFNEIPKIKNKALKKRIISRTLKQFVKEATIEVAGKSRQTYKIAYYLNNKLQSYGTKYKVVDVSFVSFELGNLLPLPGHPGEYYINYKFVQRYCRSNEGKRTPEGLLDYDYCDLTTKKGRFIVKRVHTVIGAKWKIYFDSISVVDIEVIKRK
jgi:hypothetical protein